MKALTKIIAIVCCMVFITSSTVIAQIGTESNAVDTTAEAADDNIIFQTAAGNSLKITADNVNVDVQLASDEQYGCNYDNSKFTVATAINGSTFEITVTAKSGAEIGWNDRVTVYIPNQTYTLITGVSQQGGLSLPAVNANITVTNNSGAVSVMLPSNYSGTVNYTGVSGSGSLAMNGSTNFAVDANFSNCAVSVPGDWSAYNNGSSSYSYICGNGTAKININLMKCSFSFNK